jgi:hypothetical protein
VIVAVIEVRAVVIMCRGPVRLEMSMGDGVRVIRVRLVHMLRRKRRRQREQRRHDEADDGSAAGARHADDYRG